MTLVKTVTFKLNQDEAVFCDAQNLLEGDELFLNKSNTDEYEIFSADGYSIVTFSNDEELKNYLGYTFNDFEDHSFEVKAMNELDLKESRITLTIKFDVHDLAC